MQVLYIIGNINEIMLIRILNSVIPC